MTSRPSTAGRLATIALVVFAVVALSLGAYVGGYLWLGEAILGYDNPGKIFVIQREYQYLWQRNIFQPAARVEGRLRGMEVRAVCGLCKIILVD